ncbi:hypothetical protein, partial [Pantoea wallisii]|uniref:hypothetical protein n=1 Tax=Pantoea wallisii TaxID=1076551 RepID=UPI001ABF8B3D
RSGLFYVCRSCITLFLTLNISVLLAIVLVPVKKITLKSVLKLLNSGFEITNPAKIAAKNHLLPRPVLCCDVTTDRPKNRYPI